MLIKISSRIMTLAFEMEKELFEDMWMVESRLRDDVELLKQRLGAMPSEKTRRLADVVGALKDDVCRLGDELEADRGRG